MCYVCYGYKCIEERNEAFSCRVVRWKNTPQNALKTQDCAGGTLNFILQQRASSFSRIISPSNSPVRRCILRSAIDTWQFQRKRQNNFYSHAVSSLHYGGTNLTPQNKQLIEILTREIIHYNTTRGVASPCSEDFAPSRPSLNQGAQVHQSISKVIHGPILKYIFNAHKCGSMYSTICSQVTKVNCAF